MELSDEIKREIEKHSGIQWKKNPILILLVIILSPVFLTFWVLRQKWAQNKKVRLTLAMIWLALFIPASIIIGGVSHQQKDTVKDYIANPTKAASTPVIPSATHIPVVTLAPTMPPKPTVTPAESYNSSRGNNRIAAKQAQQLLEMANNITPNLITEIYLSLHPTDIGNQDNESYINKVDAVALTVRINDNFWQSIDDETKKSLVTTFVKSLGVYPATASVVFVGKDSEQLGKGLYDRYNDKITVTLF